MSHNSYYNDKPQKQLQLNLDFNTQQYAGVCQKCLREISPRVFDFSTKVFGMPLCWSCQHKPVLISDVYTANSKGGEIDGRKRSKNEWSKKNK